jgi:hypothetical protein
MTEREMIERGSIIGDNEGGSWRALEVTAEGFFMLRLPEHADLVHTRTVGWQQYYKEAYELKFP